MFPSRAFSLAPLVVQGFACSMAMMAFAALVGPIGRTVGLSPWQMGTVVTLSGMAWVLAAPLWGRASDRLGRRPVLLTGIVGFALSYLVLCLFIVWSLRALPAEGVILLGLVLARSVGGVFFAAVPAASVALIADHVPAERRTRAMATMGMANGASMVIGPAVVGLMAPWGIEAPLLVVCLLPLLAAGVLWWRVPRAAPVSGTASLPPPRLHDPRLRLPVLAAFVSMGSVAVAQVVVGFYVIDRLALSPQQGAQAAGMVLATVGVSLVLTQALVRHLSMAPVRLIRWGAVCAALGFLAAGMASSLPVLCVGYGVAAMGMGMIWPSVSVLAAAAVEAHEQGAAAGAVAAAQGLGTVVGPLLGTGIYALQTSGPYWLVATVMAAVAIFAQRTPKNGGAE